MEKKVKQGMCLTPFIYHPSRNISVENFGAMLGSTQELFLVLFPKFASGNAEEPFAVLQI